MEKDQYEATINEFDVAGKSCTEGRGAGATGTGENQTYALARSANI